MQKKSFKAHFLSIVANMYLLKYIVIKFIFLSPFFILEILTSSGCTGQSERNHRVAKKGAHRRLGREAGAAGAGEQLGLRVAKEHSPVHQHLMRVLL
jgi:hypothetical protein